jgi:antitoxin ParD1/3/4
MNLHLTAELEQLVQDKVKSGQYSSATEVVQDALRLLQQRDELFVRCKEDVRQKIDEGWDAVKRGEFVDGDKVFDRIDRGLTSLQPPSQK